MANFFNTKRGYFLCLILLFFCKNGACQYKSVLALSKYDPYALNHNGGNLTISSIHIDWTLGDIGNTHIYTNKNTLIVSSGFLQNAYDFSARYKQLEIFGEQIKVGPNPISNNIHVSCAQDGMDILSIELFNQTGICFKKIQGPYAGYKFDMLIPIEKLTHPLFFMQIKYRVANQWIFYKSLKIGQY